MIYVIHVQSGWESDVCQSLAKIGLDGRAPEHELLERRKGQWHKVRRTLFPGYVFLVADRMTDGMYYAVRKTDGVVRFLGRPPTPLSVSEAARLSWILDAGVLTVSEGYVDEDGIHITGGILQGREKFIVKYSRRRKRCTLFCEINRRRIYYDISAELTIQ